MRSLVGQKEQHKEQGLWASSDTAPRSNPALQTYWLLILYRYRQATLNIKNTYTPALHRLRQEDCSKLMARLGYRVGIYLGGQKKPVWWEMWKIKLIITPGWVWVWMQHSSCRRDTEEGPWWLRKPGRHQKEKTSSEGWRVLQVSQRTLLSAVEHQ